MKSKLYKTGIACGILLGTTILVYAITSLFYTHSVTSNLSKKQCFSLILQQIWLQPKLDQVITLK